MMELLSPEFNVTLQENLKLLTIRHFNEGILQQLTKDVKVLLEERIKDTVKLVIA